MKIALIFIPFLLYSQTLIDKFPEYKPLSKMGIIEDYSNNKNTLKEIKDSIDNKTLKILMIGDSHIAGDFMGYELREILGDINSIGLVLPLMPQSHQNLLLHYTSNDFEILDSRNEKRDDYPLGGIIARPTQPNASISLMPNESIFGKQKKFSFTLLVKSAKKYSYLMLVDSNLTRYIIMPQEINKWEFWDLGNLNISFPLTIKALDENIMIGGYSINNKDGNVIQSIGINGIRSDFWRRWNREIIKEQLENTDYNVILLCFGSNEAMYDKYNVEYYKDVYKDLINLVSQNHHAMIIIMAPPDVRINKKGEYEISPLFDDIKHNLREIARENKIYLFDMSDFIAKTGGKDEWIEKKLSKKDVHLTPSGYRLMASGFYNALKELSHKIP